jgi:oxygen-independent coproporphyrinogen-3 oxidase
VYWTCGDYWPIGPGAAGHVGGVRWKNVPRLAEYLESGPCPPIEDVELPDPQRSIGESFMLGLRMLEGLPLARVESLLGADRDRAQRRAAIERGVQGGLLERTERSLRLTPRGLLLADTVLAELL